MWCFLKNKILNRFKKKPLFEFGDIDKQRFRALYVNGKITNIKLYHFYESDIKELHKIAKELYEKNEI